MVLCDDFVKFDVQTNLKYSKISPVLHSALSTAFGFFFSYLNHYLKQWLFTIY